MTMLTVTGRQEHTTIPSARLGSSALTASMRRERPYAIPETAPKLNSWT